MSAPRPRILLTNDDGIYAGGLERLAQALAPVADLWISAPEREHSGMGHALTLHDLLEVLDVERPHAQQALAVRGTPADAVKFAVTTGFAETDFDLVVSGINRGPNTGTNIIYSGTVAAALEGLICELPAVAVSMDVGKVWDFAAAADITADIVDRLLHQPLPSGMILNVNVPNIEREQIKGRRLTRMGFSGYRESYVAAGQSTDGARRYAIDGVFLVKEPGLDYDAAALRDGYVTITPLALDLTAHDQLARDWSHLL
jgi:5'-nucleotidase